MRTAFTEIFLCYSKIIMFYTKLQLLCFLKSKIAIFEKYIHSNLQLCVTTFYYTIAHLNLNYVKQNKI